MLPPPVFDPNIRVWPDDDVDEAPVAKPRVVTRARPNPAAVPPPYGGGLTVDVRVNQPAAGQAANTVPSGNSGAGAPQNPAANANAQPRNMDAFDAEVNKYNNELKSIEEEMKGYFK
jgi:hypothetical protein